MIRNSGVRRGAVVCSSMMLGTTARALVRSRSFSLREDVIKYTPDWHGERFPDGRPKVPDDILDRMKNVTLEEAWATLQQRGFQP